MRALSEARQAIVAAILGMVITLSFYGYLRIAESEHATAQIQNEAYNIQRQLRQTMINHLFMVEWIAREWEQNDQAVEERWQADANIITLYYQGVQTLVWLDPQRRIKKVFPEQGNYGLVGSQFSGTETIDMLANNDAIQHAIVGKAGNLGRHPTDIGLFVQVDGAEKGIFGAILSLQDLINNVVRANISEGFQLALANENGLLYSFQGDQQTKQQWQVNTSLQVLGNRWTLTVWPTPNKLEELLGGVSTAVLTAGLAVTLLLTFVLYIFGVSRHRSQELADTNLELYAEIEERERVEQQMAYLAEHDALTGLANRNALMRFLTEKMPATEQHKTILAVIFIDLDRFKEVNDALGHTVGDELLKRVARRLQKIAPESTFIARTGGDEFVLAAPDSESSHYVTELAKQLLLALDTHFFVDAYELFISASIGIAFAEDADYSAENVVRNADTALYQAKEAGRNTYQIYSRAVHRDLTEKLELMKRLRHAVEQENLVVYYQPKIDLNSRRIIGAEALVRWVEDDGKVIGPDQFIPIAEDTGLIIPISDFVMRQATEQLKQWHDLGYDDLTMAINISGKQLHTPDLIDKVLDTVHQARIGPQFIELELTEQVFIENIQSHRHFMHAIREHGIALAIDDFGVGYSSLSYLKNFPVTSLKIDRSFVQDLPGDNDDATITQTIINLAKNLEIDIVAEGIETEQQVDFLMERECFVGQGFLFSRPIPAEQFTQLLQKYQGLIPIQIA